jgi:hypothetical protein
VLNISQTWHQVRPGEVRNDCGGCHAHAQRGLEFEKTAAAKWDYQIHDLTRQTPVLSKNALGETITKYLDKRLMSVEFHRDIKPILKRSCVQCHTAANMQGNLNLDDDFVVGGFDNTYNRLADDRDAKFGYKPVINSKTWRGTNASRYVRSFQSRRSLLIWKIFGARLDGWTNADHPTESTLGDASTLPTGSDPNLADIDYTGTIMPPPNSTVPPLSADEKMLFARWIDLGAPVDASDPALKKYGWISDEQKPTLNVSMPHGGNHQKIVKQIRFGAFDNTSGLDRTSISVKADFAINGKPAGTELAADFIETADHVWTLKLAKPIAFAGASKIIVTVKDLAGNQTTAGRTFSVGIPIESPPLGKSRQARDLDALMPATE